MGRPTHITLLTAALCLLAGGGASTLAPAAAFARALDAGAPSAAAARPARARPALAGGAAQGARWACPTGRCAAIILPRPRREDDGWRAAGAAGTAFAGGGELGGFDPRDLQSAYDIPTSLPSPQTVAVIDANGYPDAESDLAAYRSHYGLAACTKANGCFSKVNSSGEEAHYPPTETGWDEEAALDVDMVSAACPPCHIMMVETAGESAAALSQGDETAAALGASEISNSWVEGERECGDACKGYASDFEHAGVLVTASAGDEGYDGLYGSSSKKPVSPEFPADLPDVLAVGGTALYKDASVSRGWREEAWNEPDSADGIGGGSGCSSSLKVAKPSWQQDSGCAYRTDDDVAAVAAVKTPVSMRLDGAWRLAGGTSVSAPLLAGIEAHASAQTRSLGPQAFYEDPAALNDITEGFNYFPGASPCAPFEYLCNAESGYDGPTGLGSPDGVPGLRPLPPEVALGTPSEAGATSVKLQASVNPQGTEVTGCTFEYGTSTAYGKNVACSPLPGAGVGAVAVAGSLTGLKVGTSYDYRLSAESSAGTTKSPNASFTTPTAPVLTLSAASELGSSSAQLHGSVNADGLAITECVFQYGTSTYYGKSVACSPTPAGSTAVSVAAALAGLKANTSYDFRLTAKSSAGATKSANGTLRTLKAS